MKYLMLVLALSTLNTLFSQIKVGAERLEQYLPLIQNKKVALVVNPTSMVKDSHLVDVLIARKIDVVRIMGPEHGFRGTADAGEKVKDGVDPKTGLPVVSLYGKHKKPYKEDLEDIDIVIFDLQDVGVRFYTYISTLQYVMEACGEHGKSVLVLDRPNPNGHYVDGPVLEPEFKSFVGMQEIPIVHGMTVAEYANMLNHEGWLEDSMKVDLHWVTCEGYDHNTHYSLPVKPSPNLPNDWSIALYPSLCLFEGTVISVGRGTDFPFQVFGHPVFKEFDIKFTPKPNVGAKHPKLEGKECKGFDPRQKGWIQFRKEQKGIELRFLIDTYEGTKLEIDKLFNSFFEKLAGTDQLRMQIEKGLSQDEIKETWQEDLKAFKEIRKKYLLYKDFE